MTTFTDGPARGKVLHLKRAPVFLRVVVEGQDVDALDLLGDSPRASEKLYAYLMVGKPGHCHIRAAKGQGGFFTIAEYKLVGEQPTDEQMRDNAKWREWTYAHAHLYSVAQ